MIFVKLQPEPAHFDRKVRQPGKTWLRHNPTSRKFPNLWSEILPDLWQVYGGVCAYSCHWFPPIGGESVDHFKPKALARNLIYEWSNYRLAAQKLNNRKGSLTNIVDPFTISGDWFVLVFPAMLVKPGAQLPNKINSQVQITIDVLKLNEEAIVNIRLQYILEYCDGEISLKGLQKKAPLVAKELIRQHLQTRICDMVRRRTTKVIPN